MGEIHICFCEIPPYEYHHFLPEFDDDNIINKIIYVIWRIPSKPCQHLVKAEWVEVFLIAVADDGHVLIKAVRHAGQRPGIDIGILPMFSTFQMFSKPSAQI